MNQSLIQKPYALILLVVVLMSSVPAYSQKALQLTNISSGKKLLLKEGDRVSYYLNGIALKEVGVITKITESEVTINGSNFLFNDFKSIGKKRKGSGFLTFALSFVGTGMIIGSIQNANYDPCPTCQDAGSSGNGDVMGVGVGIALLGLSINTAVRNSPKDVLKKWKLESIDLPVPTTDLKK